MEDQRYIDALRQALFAPDDFTDEEVLKATDGTFLADRVRLRLALDDLYDALYDTFPPLRAARRIVEWLDILWRRLYNGMR